MDELCGEWEPDPLVSANTPSHDAEEDLRDENSQFVSGWDFLGFRKEQRIKQAAKDAIRKYGVGTCGPAGFYGTLDVHLELQDKLAQLLGTEAALVFAQGYAAISGVIPAFAKRGDVLVIDEACGFAIQKGAELSRARIFWYKHCDPEDLEAKLQEAIMTRLSLRFIITEGLFTNTGNIAPLKKIVKLARQYRFRLLLDDSAAIGALSPAGSCKYHNIPTNDPHLIICGTLSHTLGACGGFTAGSKIVIQHQVLSNQAYCFSASLPALFAVSAIKGIELMNDAKICELKAVVNAFERSYQENASAFSIRGLIIEGQPGSPIRFLQATNPSIQNDREEFNISHIRKQMLLHGYQIASRKVSPDEHCLWRPTLRICLGVGFPVESFMNSLISSLPTP